MITDFESRKDDDNNEKNVNSIKMISTRKFNLKNKFDMKIDKKTF